MPAREAPCVELGSAPRTPSVAQSPTPSVSETSISSTSSLDHHPVQPTPLFRALALPPPEPEQPPGQDELERRLPGYQRIIIPREATLIELLKQDSGVTTDEEVLCIRKAKLRVVAERVGLRRLHVLAPRLRSLTLDGSAISSLRDLGIGLVHLKILSVNRCGLNCLDGVWGLGALQEFHAAGNRLRDLQPLGALSKLRTLNLANNPIEDSGRLWTLGVCGVLRHLTLQGTPVSDEPDYVARVASALPMLVTLDGHPLNEDEEDEEIEEILGDASSNSEAETEEATSSAFADLPQEDSKPGPSHCKDYVEEELPLDKSEGPEDSDSAEELPVAKLHPIRRRPATTENAGLRPQRPDLPRRPKTAVDRPTVDAPTRLQILNTLMDEEWRTSGSRLTSHRAGAACGNIARALRRPSTAFRKFSPADISKLQKELAEETLADATRAVAAEIPRAPCLEDWAKFRAETGYRNRRPGEGRGKPLEIGMRTGRYGNPWGRPLFICGSLSSEVMMNSIDIHIDFNKRPEGVDPDEAIQRLEEIERETSERLSQEAVAGSSSGYTPSPKRFGGHLTIMRDFEMWKEMNIPSISESNYDVDALFKNIGIVEESSAN